MVKEKILQELFVVENCPFCNSKIIAPTKIEQLKSWGFCYEK